MCFVFLNGKSLDYFEPNGQTRMIYFKDREDSKKILMFEEIFSDMYTIVKQFS
jgi:hypothetical protein